jgi:hypothetical protein
MDAQASTAAVDFTVIPAFMAEAELECVGLALQDTGRLAVSTEER